MKKNLIILAIISLYGSVFISCGTTSTLSSANTQVDQGYGSISSKENTTAVGQTELGDTAFGNISWMELFQKTSGVTVKGSGRNLSVQIRGKKSMTAGHEPLFIVNGQILGNGFDNINYLDPAEVKKITILKDAASAAAYGSRGANGVVLIALK